MMVSGNNSDAGYYRKTLDNIVRVSLKNSLGNYSDIIVALREDASSDLDHKYDAYKLGNAATTLYSTIDNERFAIQGLSINESLHTIDLGFNNEANGELTLNLEEGSFDDHIVYLYDRELDQTIELSESGTYTFNSGAVKGSDRFQLILSANHILGLEEGSDQLDMVVYGTNGLVSVLSHEAIENAEINIYSINGSKMASFKNVRLGQEKWSAQLLSQRSVYHDHRV